MGEETRIVYGAECMRDQLLGCEFDISPTAFYQTNPQQTELLYQLAIDGMDLQQGDILMDAYCGSGTIGLCAAKDARDRGAGIMLLGVERNPAGIADARRNAELNGLTRSAWFMADDATDYILDAADNNERVDVLSIDPPRAGSTPEFLEAACALKPRRITYISCNPVTQERDLHQLLEELIAALVQKIRDLNDQLNIPQSIKDYANGGVKVDAENPQMVSEEEFLAKLPEIAANAETDACTPENPRETKAADFEKILKACYYDTDIDF